MSFFQRPIITGKWVASPEDSQRSQDEAQFTPSVFLPPEYTFKAFQKKDNKNVEIKFYKKGTFFDDEVKFPNIVIKTDEFYRLFVPHLNHTTGDPLRIHPFFLRNNDYKEVTFYGTWTCDKADKERVLASMPTVEMVELKSEGGKRHKRSGHKKRKSQKKRKSHVFYRAPLPKASNSDDATGSNNSVRSNLSLDGSMSRSRSRSNRSRRSRSNRRH